MVFHLNHAMLHMILATGYSLNQLIYTDFIRLYNHVLSTKETTGTGVPGEQTIKLNSLALKVVVNCMKLIILAT